MKFFTDFFKAIGNCLKAFSIIFEKGLWPYMFIFLFFWLALWILSIYGLFILADGLSDWLSNYIEFNSIPQSGHWLSFAKPYLIGTVSFLVKILFKLVLWFTTSTLIKYVLLMILSPVFALLSEKAEEKLTGKSFPFSLKQLFKDILRGIAISFRNMLLEYFFILTCFFVSIFFPPLFIITTPFLLFLGWYFVGFALLDYNSERHKYGVSKSIQFIKQNRGTACGIGFVYSFFMALPFFPGSIVGIMFGPSVGVVGSTICFMEINKIDTIEVKKV
ncbi:MAG: EI24 domain-containing protein [Bacteroidetes bacterium]|nr:EI24 domain-containing protein [Bacteroidota bacterium]